MQGRQGDGKRRHVGSWAGLCLLALVLVSSPAAAQSLITLTAREQGLARLLDLWMGTQRGAVLARFIAEPSEPGTLEAWLVEMQREMPPNSEAGAILASLNTESLTTLDSGLVLPPAMGTTTSAADRMGTCSGTTWDALRALELPAMGAPGTTGTPLLMRREIFGDLADDAEAAQQLLSDTARDAVKRCGQDRTCMAIRLTEATTKGPFRRLMESTCLGRHPQVLQSVAFSYFLHTSTLITAYMASSLEEFPFDLLFASYIMSAIYWNVACKNTHENGGAEAGAAPRTRLRRFLWGYKEYLKWLPFELVLYPGASMTEDYIRGHDPFSREKAQDYLTETAYLVGFGLVWGIPAEILVIDPLYINKFPVWRRWLNDLVHSKALRHLGDGRLARAVTLSVGQLPGAGMELSGRWLIGVGEDWVFLEGRKRAVGVVAPEIDAWLDELGWPRAAPPPENDAAGISATREENPTVESFTPLGAPSHQDAP